MPAPTRHASRLYPLDLAYREAGLAPPRARAITPGRLPRPYRALLVHEDDMTLTLERHHGSRVLLRTLYTAREDGWYLRRVLLVRADTGRPVEMGAIRLRLAALPVRVRRQVLAGVLPLGRVLRDGGVDFHSRPRAFLAVQPNAEMLGVFWMRAARTLYGRQTALSAGGDHLGDIVEVLPRD